MAHEQELVGFQGGSSSQPVIQLPVSHHAWLQAPRGLAQQHLPEFSEREEVPGSLLMSVN